MFGANKDFVPITQSAVEIPEKGAADDDTDDISESCAENASDTDDSDEEESEKETDKEKAVYSRLHSIAAVLVLFVITLVTSLFMCEYAKNDDGSYLFYAKMITLYAIVSAAALTDYKRHIIPNALIIFGLIARVVFYVLEFIFKKDVILQIAQNDLTGFVLGFVILFVIALIAKNSLGFGDVKLCGIIGIMGGGTCAYVTLFVCFLVCALASVVMLVARKKNRKSLISLAPFIYIGLLSALIMGLY